MPATIRLDQTKPLPITIASESSFSLRYAFDRSADSIHAETPGQDYLAINFERGRLAFVLCDGVSQSFYGDLAARILGDALVEWLWDQGSIVLERRYDFQDSTTDFLQQLSKGASAQVRTFPLPENMAPMLREVLEKKRALGSETTFTAGYIDTRSRQIQLAWMGDSRLRVWDQRSELTDTLLGMENFKTAERWSTCRACVGRLHTVQLSTSLVARLMTYSDGLARLDRRIRQRSPGNATLAQLIEESQYLPTSDDISFLEANLGAPLDWHPPRPKAPAQLRAETNSESKELRAYWRPAPQATAYEVALISARGWQIQPATTPQWSAKVATLPPHVESIAVRAWQQAEASPWSRLERVNLSSEPASFVQPGAPVISHPAVMPEPLPAWDLSPDTQPAPSPRLAATHFCPTKLRFMLVMFMLIILVVATLGLLVAPSLSKRNTPMQNAPSAVQTHDISMMPVMTVTSKGPISAGKSESWLERLKKNWSAGLLPDIQSRLQDPLFNETGLSTSVPSTQHPVNP
jgi:hypothetical protein